MVMTPRTRRLRQRAIIAERIQELGLSQRYELFFVTGEGRYLPAPGWEDVEETSGFVLFESGRVFFFWLGWDPAREGPGLTEWEEETPEDHWKEAPEYQKACAKLGLSLPSS